MKVMTVVERMENERATNGWPAMPLYTAAGNVWQRGETEAHALPAVVAPMPS